MYLAGHRWDSADWKWSYILLRMEWSRQKHKYASKQTAIFIPSSSAPESWRPSEHFWRDQPASSIPPGFQTLSGTWRVWGLSTQTYLRPSFSSGFLSFCIFALFLADLFWQVLLIFKHNHPISFLSLHNGQEIFIWSNDVCLSGLD